MNLEPLKSDKLPGLYRTADSISNQSQKEYFWMALCYLTLLLVGSILAYITAFYPESQSLAIFSALAFLCSLGMNLAIYFIRPEASWYSARAVAESVKTRTWRWMMRADPYTDRDRIDQARKEFISDLKAILDQNREMANRIAGDHCADEPITDRMEEIRRWNFNDRFEIYKIGRIDNQLEWYKKKTAWNRKRSRQWLVVSIILNFAAIMLLLIKIAKPNLIMPIEIIAFLAGSALTWTQMKKFRELATSYGLTAHEISLIKGEASNVSDEQHFSEFVLNSENAFSREHTQWVARKE